MASIGAVDYVVFFAMLGVSIAIGVYHAVRARKKSSTNDFLLANREMSEKPVFLSLIATFISAIAILG